MWSKLCNGKQGGSGCGQNYQNYVMETRWVWSKLCNGKQGGSGCGQNYVRWVWSKLCNGNKVGVVKIM